ncbi:MAG: HicB family toxin-antitoxin system, partial [Mycobacterium sp.]
VRRDGNWWMVEIPEITGLTQARRIGEVEEMARSLIAVSTGSRPEDVGIRITGVQAGALGDIAQSVREVTQLREQAREVESQASQAFRSLIRSLSDHGIPVRDTATLLQVSPQRVSQLSSE